MKLSFRNRIALYYMIATAIIIAIVFGVVYFVVKGTVYKNLDYNLSFEAKKHTTEIKIMGDSILFVNKAEWAESEHIEAQVSPVFIQIITKNGDLMDKSPNLKGQYLLFRKNNASGAHFDTELNNNSIRQVQIPIEQKGEIKGYILAAMSLESASMVLLKLRNILFLSYPVILLGLFFISRFLAGRSITPIKSITKTTNRITKNNLQERVNLPENKDELYQLSSSINGLLQRIENAINRERQFTSDASHELRTPLASLRGTLEVLIRKNRSQDEYEGKIRYSLSEIDKMTGTIEQLLQLARFDIDTPKESNTSIGLVTLIDTILSKHSSEISTKNIKINFNSTSSEAFVPQHYSQLILENIISNSIKYSHKKGIVTINIKHKDEKLICEITDAGVGIKEEDLKHVFNPFYRSGALSHKAISGNGLGLSIAQKAADAIDAKIYIESILGEGTTLTVVFLIP